MPTPRAWVLAIALLAGPPASACPPFIASTLVGHDRNGGAAEPGDVVDWTVEVTQYGCSGGCPGVHVPLEGMELVSAGENGYLDPDTGGVRWDSTRTPTLARIPQGVSVRLGFVTVVREVSPLPARPDLGPAGVCAQAVAEVGWNECWTSPGPPCLSNDPATPFLDPTCLPTPPPLVVDPLPACLAVDAVPFELELTGAGFTPSTVVSLDGVAGLLVEVEPTRLRVRFDRCPAGRRGLVLQTVHHRAELTDALLCPHPSLAPNSLRLTRAPWEIRAWIPDVAMFELSRDPGFPCPIEWYEPPNGRPTIIPDPIWGLWFIRAR